MNSFRALGRALLVAGVALTPATLFFVPVRAQDAFQKALRKHYGLEKDAAKCSLCHELKEAGEEPKGHNLNSYGTDIQRQPDFLVLMGKDGEYEFTEDDLAVFLKSAKAVEGLDSDGDGATNREELALGTNPGEKDSKPAAEKLGEYRKAQPAKTAAPEKTEEKK